MDEFSWNPDMERFVALLVDRTSGRPVLQFNHIDFRLQWFRRTFPTAYLVHIFRHPRDQWCSSLVDPQSFPRDGRMEDFAASDHFYLRRWARDLQYHFPFLDESGVRHPYELFYYLWKLSYLFGRAYCHFSLAFERLVSEPTTELRRLFDAVGLVGAGVETPLDADRAAGAGEVARICGGLLVPGDRGGVRRGDGPLQVVAELLPLLRPS